MLLLSAIVVISCNSDREPVWFEEEGYRWANVSPGFFDRTGFEQLSPGTTGIDFVNHLYEESIVANQNLLNGSGVATGDIDGDGLVDIYFAGLDTPNKLYRNLGGFRFEDITEQSGLAHEGYRSTGVVFADIDGDGNLDLIITSLDGPNSIYLNDGSGHFELVEESGLGFGRGSTTAALADIDGNGYLDLYITNYKDRTAKDIFDPSEFVPENMIAYTEDIPHLVSPYDEYFVLLPGSEGPSIQEIGMQDELYLNNGDGTFQKVTDLESRFLDSDGNPLGLQADWGLTAKFQDINGNGLPDLYVCNDFWTPDRLWINMGDGIFQAADEHTIRNMSFSSMGVDFSDINRDGVVDIFVTEMLDTQHEHRARQMQSIDPNEHLIGNSDYQPLYMRNSLYLGRPDHTFAEITHYSGTESTGWSWATRFLDVDLDGYEDLIITTGHAYDVLDLDTQRELSLRDAGRGYMLEHPPLKLPNVALRNNGDLTFTDSGTDWGFTEEDISHGLATADFDNDGDLDLVINRLNNNAAIFKNISSAPRIAVRLNGRKPNTQAIGAIIELTGGPVPQMKEIVSGGDYLSGSDPFTVFAASGRSDAHRMVVTWPGGHQTHIDDVSANRIYEVDEPGTQATVTGMDREVMPPSPTMFEDVTDRLNFSHFENDFRDDLIQPLLPALLSRPGPGVAAIDVDGDGHDDIIVGSGYGGYPAIFRNIGSGRFEQVELADITDSSPGDITSIIGWGEGDGTSLLFGVSGYESAYVSDAAPEGSQTTGTPVAVESLPPSAIYYRTDLSEVSFSQQIPGVPSVTGVIVAADYTGNGAPDLFVGGRFIPGKYPSDAESRLFKNTGNGFVYDEENSRLLSDIGMVTGAVFTDYDGDGDPDLLISTGWGSLKLFQNSDGVFRDVTESAGLADYTGWWNGIATGDFNNNGRPDIVATNIGMNSSYQTGAAGEPLKMFYGDFNGNSIIEIIEAYHDDDIGGYVPKRSLHDLYAEIPSIARNVSSYRDFGASTLDEILGVPLNSIPSREINTLQSMIFINEGGTFTAHPLPVEAQLSAAFYAGVADFNNNGNEDLFLGQNQFTFPAYTPRLDAGRGLLLLGDGAGNFTAVEGEQSGIRVYGEQRGAALSDLNGNGKVDLVISQNNDPVKMYMNRTEAAGIRVRLSGPAMNTSGIGSSIRLVYPDGEKGPRREVQAGSGYLSQNSVVQVLGMAANPLSIEVTWFDGTVEQVDIEQDKMEYTVIYGE